MIKIDLHVHASERSACARSTEEEQIEAAQSAGLGAIAFTDHWRFISSERLKALNHKYAPFRIFGGIEVTAAGEDFLVFGVYSTALENNGWTYPALHSFVHQQGGFLVLAHPFRYNPQIRIPMEVYPPDAIEVRSINTPPAAEAQIRSAAYRLKIPLICNSDSHHIETMGSFYNLLEHSVENEVDLFQALGLGQYQCYARNHTVETAHNTGRD